MKIDQAPYIPMRITSGYGNRNVAGLPAGSTAFHAGIDIGRDLSKYNNHLTDNPCGYVYSALPGTVVDIGNYSGRGWTVKIYHGKIDGKEVHTRYQHLHPIINIKKGTPVKQGQVIAQMGRTGMGSDMSVHLHFELILNNKTVDPMPYFTQAARKTQSPAIKTTAEVPGGTLADKVKITYKFSTETMVYLSAYKFADEMYRKMLAGESLGAETITYINRYKHGQAILNRVYTKKV